MKSRRLDREMEIMGYWDTETPTDKYLEEHGEAGKKEIRPIELEHFDAGFGPKSGVKGKLTRERDQSLAEKAVRKLFGLEKFGREKKKNSPKGGNLNIPETSRNRRGVGKVEL